VDGLRALVGADARPLLCTALKPMGFTPAMLADLAYKLALGGLDIIKDDHGLANQPFCPFNERVERCAEAVAKANRETGLNCLYAPNVTAPHDALLERARFAKSAGAGAFLLSYGLTGIDGLRLLSTNDALGLPVIAHAALTGGFVVTPTVGISHYALYGQIVRLAGGDASIFVSYGGRFPYSEAQCRGVIEGCSVAMGHLRTIFPTPGGGMTIERLPELKAFYGRDVMFLIAGGLYRYSDDLVANARQFAQASRV
jgi:ribulose-bisphosphate carboxylase large chain